MPPTSHRTLRQEDRRPATPVPDQGRPHPESTISPVHDAGSDGPCATLHMIATSHSAEPKIDRLRTVTYTPRRLWLKSLYDKSMASWPCASSPTNGSTNLIHYLADVHLQPRRSLHIETDLRRPTHSPKEHHPFRRASLICRDLHIPQRLLQPTSSFHIRAISFCDWDFYLLTSEPNTGVMSDASCWLSRLAVPETNLSRIPSPEPHTNPPTPKLTRSRALRPPTRSGNARRPLDCHLTCRHVHERRRSSLRSTDAMLTAI
ncbi:hypothetical protein FAGAP_940 [Fusarium agapanthi]|uniref:Uncharacterized protein n=1 Tax=Fusarium agapanthi TaxID=1803897 RepID=A0A9P5BIH7_9HYPO|nr:hypothetical protein FAGAP_940 [Fusarium agapanthi]